MRLARSRITIGLALLLLFLSGCASAHAPEHYTPTTVPPLPTNTPYPFLVNDHDPFQAVITENAPVALCPSSSRPTDLCFNVTGTGNAVPFGAISFSSFDINFVAPGKGPITNYNQDPGYCEPTTRNGSITLASMKATLAFAASGTWCFSLVHFKYQVTGGAGKFRDAHGSGAIYIPDPVHNTTEYWTGTLTP